MPQPTNAEITESQLNLYENYARAVIDFLRGVLWYPKDGVRHPIPFVIATKERAFARACKEWGVDLKRIPYPFASIDVVGEVYDPTRKQTNHVRYGGISYDNKQMTRYPYPAPYNFTFQCSLWTRLYKDIHRFKAQLIPEFHKGTRGNYGGTAGHFGIGDCNEVFLTVMHPWAFGEKRVPMTLEGIDFTGTKEPGAGKQRIVSMDLTLLVKGWYSAEHWTVPTVLKLDIGWYDAADVDADPDPDDLVEEVTVFDFKDQPPGDLSVDEPPAGYEGGGGI